MEMLVERFFLTGILTYLKSARIFIRSILSDDKEYACGFGDVVDSIKSTKKAVNFSTSHYLF